MKKLLAFCLLSLLLSCGKKSSDAENPETVCVDGILEFHDPALDGAGWVLTTTTDSIQFYMLLESSVPDSFRTSPRPVAVAACLRETNVRYRYPMLPASSNFNYYRLTSIRKR